MSGGLRSQGVAVSMGGSTWLQDWTPQTITDWATQPGKIAVSQGCPGTASTVTWGAGGVTLAQTGDATGHYWNTSSHEGRPLGLSMPCALQNFTADVVLDTMSGFGVGGETEVALGYYRGSVEKPVCTGRLIACYTVSGASRSVFKTYAGHNGTIGSAGAVSPAAPSTSLGLRIQVRSGKEFKAWYSVDGGAWAEIDAGTWRAPGNPIDCSGIGTGFLNLLVGSSAAGSTNQSCRVSSWVVS